ncbi:MAG TPA: PIN domain-containing protein [Bacteroidia bacterium]|nr:PIN domain-containing protein [Bacteroidia bacterium]
MKRAFLDTNVLIDFIADRKPFSKFANQIFSAAENKQVKLYTSSHSIATTHYVLKKYASEKELREVLSDFLDYLTVVAVDVDIIKRALKSRHKDFEDALQIVAAQSIDRIDCIITRNVKDFKEAEIMVLSPDQFIEIM